MKNVFLAMITVLTLSMASMTSYASTDGGVGKAVAAQCLNLPNVAPADALKYMVLVGAQTQFLEGIGAAKAFDHRVPADVQAQGGDAADGFRAFINGDAKCIALTQAQLIGLLKCVQAELDVIDEAKMLPTYFNWLIQNLGKEKTLDFTTAAAKVTKALEGAVKK